MLLILREEIICAVILIFLIFYYLTNKVKEKELPFLKLVCFALLHVIFDIITVITVNNLDTVPEPVNRILHILFYISGILFIMGFYQYVINLASINKYRKILLYVGYIPLVIFIPLLVVLPMEYIEGRGTNYSFGLLTFVGYGLFVVYCIICMILLLTSHEKLERKIKRALIPMVILMFAAIMIQALVPELLMTGAGVTFVCLGMFVTLDNPDKEFKEQALWDSLTGLKNRNCYNKDFADYVNKSKHKHLKRRIGFLVADLNYLKTVNDNYGHAEGDKIIKAAADVLHNNLTSATDVYRLGGDEFVAIYISPDDEKVTSEIEMVKRECAKATGYVVPLRIAMGYFSGIIDEHAGEIFDKADELMYENKENMKKFENNDMQKQA